MAEGGWSSGKWSEAAWGMSVYVRDAEDAATAADSDFVSGSTYNSALADTATGSDAISSSQALVTHILDSATVTDLITPIGTYSVAFSAVAAGSETNSAQQVFDTATNESASAADTNNAAQEYNSQIAETSTGTDEVSSNFAFFGLEIDFGVYRSSHCLRRTLISTKRWPLNTQGTILARHVYSYIRCNVRSRLYNNTTSACCI